MNFYQNIKNLFRHSAIYTIASVLQRFIGFAMLPFLTDPRYVANQASFGDYSLFYTFIAFSNVFFLLGMDSSFVRFGALQSYSQRRTFSTAYFAVVLSGIFISIILYLSKDELSRLIFLDASYSYLILLAIAILLTDALCNLPYILLRIQERSILFSVIKIARFTIELGLNIYFVVFLKYGWEGILYGNLIAAGINALILLMILYREFLPVFDVGLLKELYGFAIPLIPNSIAFLLIEQVDRLIVPRILDKTDLGIYAANYRFGMIIGMLVYAFRNAWQPFFMKTSEQEDAKSVFAGIFRLYSSLLAGLLVVASLFIGPFIRLKLPGLPAFMNESYWSGIEIIPVLLSAYFFYGIYVFFSLGVYIQNKSRWIGLITLAGAGLNIAMNILLLEDIGIFAAALATLGAYVLMAVLLTGYNQSIYRLPIHWNHFIKLLVISLLSLLSIYLLPDDIMYRLLIFVAYLIAIYSFKILTMQQAREFIGRLRG
jgi:O-antigen/teichoic acid export membrane protein